MKMFFDTYELKLKQLELIQPLLNKEEKEQAEALQLKIQTEQTEKAEQKDREKENVGIALSNNVTTRYSNRLGEFFDTVTGQVFPDPQSFFKAANVSSFAEAYEKGLVTDISGTDKVLSVAEAKSLGVPYGTTQREAQKLNVVPTNSSSGGTTPSSNIPANDAGVRNWLLKNKRENAGIPYYELWGQLAEDMQAKGLNPANYDKLFWEVLHPEGEAGYAAEQKKKKEAQKTTTSSDSDPIDSLINNALKQEGI